MKKLFHSKLSVFIAAVIGSAVISFGTCAGAFTFTWFTHNNAIDNNNISGKTLGAYFASGDGTAENPYVINAPIHLRNLAWLQYIGKFNQIDSTTGDYNQTYFVIEADLDMSGYVLPPIGTTLYPFIGNLDGNGNTISNLTVSNDYSEMTKTPSFIKSVEDCNVIGLFGVVGDPGDAVEDSAYDSSINEITGFNIQGCTVKDTLSTTLIGMAAGYVNASVSDVNISACTLTVPDSGASAYNSSLTSNLSNYTSIGYCEEAYRGAMSKVQTDVATADPIYTTGSYEGEGEAAGWGGSIDMKSLYNRISDIWDDSTSTTYSTATTTESIYPDKETESTTTTGTSYNFLAYDGGKAGKASFSRYGNNSSDKTYLYLYGQEDFGNTITSTTYKKVEKETSGYILGDGTNWITISGSTISSTTDKSQAEIWTLGTATGTKQSSGGGGRGGGGSSTNVTVYTFRTSDSAYYLGVTITSSGRGGPGSSSSYSLSLDDSLSSGGSMGSTTSFSGYWCLSGTSYYYDSSVTVSGSGQGGPGGQGGSSTTQYLTYSGGFTLSSNAGTVYLDTYTGTTYSYEKESTSTRVEPYATTNPTYLPLNVDSSYNAKSGNTGYILSGPDYHASNYPYKSGDARVSQYSMTDIYNALNGSSSSTSFSDSKFEVVTRTANSNGFVRISDDYNASNTSVSRTLSNAVGTKTNYSTLGLTKYKASRESVSTLLSGDSNIYGIHYLDAEISKDRLIKADYAMINGKEYDDGNYELPENCIDFNLADRGAVNFFAGSYYSGNDSFFSLHEITREGESITNIKEIQRIYGDSNVKHTYVYEYSDGTYSKAQELVKGVGTDMEYSGNYPSSYSLVFDTDWIKTPSTWVDYAVYYYEIPINKGEYALGSVPDHDGAYLLYLDIGGNAQELQKTSITSTKTTTTTTYDYPLGVSFAPNGTEINDETDSAAMALTSSFTGSIEVDRSGDTISYEASASSAVQASFKGDDITLEAGSTEITELTPASTSSETDKIMTNIDYNAATDETTTTVYTEAADGTQSVVITKSDGSESEGEWGETEIDTTGVVTDLSYYYFSYGDATITAKVETTYEEFTDDENKTRYKVSGYKITVTADQDLKLTVSQAGDGYAIYVNDTLVGTIPSTVDITATS